MEIFFRITGPLCGKFTGHRWIPAHRPVTRSFGGFLISAWINGWVNIRVAVDLRRHRAYHDVNVMIWHDIIQVLSWKIQLEKNVRNSATHNILMRRTIIMDLSGFLEWESHFQKFGQYICQDGNQIHAPLSYDSLASAKYAWNNWKLVWYRNYKTRPNFIQILWYLLNIHTIELTMKPKPTAEIRPLRNRKIYGIYWSQTSPN